MQLKKIIILSILASSLLFGKGKADIEYTNIKDKQMREFLTSLHEQLPIVLEVIKDYYEAKTCSNDFYNKVSIVEVKTFTTQKHFGTLYNIKNIKGAEAKYKELLNDYKYMNCGEGELFKIPDLNKLR